MLPLGAAETPDPETSFFCPFANLLSSLFTQQALGVLCMVGRNGVI